MTRRDRKQLEKRINAAAKYLADYFATYQASGLTQDATFIHDALYGLGVALHGDQARFANGYAWWRGELIKLLQEQAA